MNDTVTIMNDESDCQSGFLKDSTYLIGAWNSNRYLGTSQCEGTGLLSQFMNQLDSLGEGGTPKPNDRNNNKPTIQNTDDNLNQSETGWTESILLSLSASAIFAIVIFILRWMYFKYWLYRNVAGKYYRNYDGENQTLQNEISALAEVSRSAMNELVITVTTYINEDESLSHKDHYLFPNESIQKWTGRITMVNTESGSGFYYYVQGIDEKFRSNFKRVLFNSEHQMVKIFDDDRTSKP